MHFAEALIPRDEAIAMAAEVLRGLVARNAAYYARAPASTPDPQQPVLAAIRAEDAWYFIPFARRGGVGQPVTVRVNGLTKAVVVDAKF